MKPFILSFAMLSMVCATATSELAFARGGSAGHSGGFHSGGSAGRSAGFHSGNSTAHAAGSHSGSRAGLSGFSGSRATLSAFNGRSAGSVRFSSPPASVRFHGRSAVARFGHPARISHFRGSHAGIGIVAVAPAFWYPPPPYYYSSPAYYDPAYYYSPPIGVTAVPSVYEEQSAQPAPQGSSQSQGNWWYYCEESKLFYPYATECPGGWQQVAPQPPSG